MSRAIRRSGNHFISNLMFGSKHQIARKTAPLRPLSRTYADFISDLKFGFEHQIQSASALFCSIRSTHMMKQPSNEPRRRSLRHCVPLSGQSIDLTFRDSQRAVARGSRRRCAARHGRPVEAFRGMDEWHRLALPRNPARCELLYGCRALRLEPKVWASGFPTGSDVAE
jgi:hypothetical protein